MLPILVTRVIGMKECKNIYIEGYKVTLYIRLQRNQFFWLLCAYLSPLLMFPLEKGFYKRDNKTIPTKDQNKQLLIKNQQKYCQHRINYLESKTPCSHIWLLRNGLVTRVINTKEQNRKIVSIGTYPSQGFFMQHNFRLLRDHLLPFILFFPYFWTL